jgi:hypothetical protein
MTDILYHFLLDLGWGMLAVLPLVPPREIGRSYYVVVSLCVLAAWITALSMGSGGDLGRLNLWGAGAVAALMVSFMLDPTRAPRPALGFLLLSLACGLVAIVESAASLAGDRFYTHIWYLATTFLVSSLVAGGTLVAMILGHFYLVTPRLSFGFLGRFTKLLAALLVVRLVMAVTTAVAGDVFVSPEGADASIFFIDHVAFLLQRGLTILALMILLPMIWDCVQRRANQSATGLLYVAAFLAILGEGVATYFAVAYDLPI